MRRANEGHDLGERPSAIGSSRPAKVPEGALRGFEPTGAKVVCEEHLGCLIGRLKGGFSTKTACGAGQQGASPEVLHDRRRDQR